MELVPTKGAFPVVTYPACCIYGRAGTQSSSDELFDFMQAVDAVLKSCARGSAYGEATLVVEEIVTNVAKHGPGSADDTLLELRIGLVGRVIQMEFRDSGKPFDPLSELSPDLSATPEHREAGGLGIFLVRSLVDAIGYRRDREMNVLSVALPLH